MQKTFYFPHDYNAKSDDKIKDLIFDLGWAGYGIYWAVVEDLYNNANAMRINYERIAHDLKTDVETIKKVINNYGLFKIKGEIFFSESIKKRLQDREEKSTKAKISASYRWNKGDANANRTQTERNAVKERKGKENKVKYKREISKRKNEFEIPEIEDVKNYFIEKKSSEFEAEKFKNFYQSKNWMVGKNKMKDWHAAANGWISRNKQDFSKLEIQVKSKHEQQSDRIKNVAQNLIKSLKDNPNADIRTMEIAQVHS